MNSILKNGWIRATLFFIVFFITFILSDKTSLFVFNLLSNQPDELIQPLISQSITLIYAFVLVYIFRKFLDKKSILSLGFSIKGRLKDIMIAIG